MCPDGPAILFVCRSRWPNRPDRAIEGASGESLFDALRSANQPIASSCAGQLVCGRCIVRVVAGADYLSEMDEEERSVLLRESAGPDDRLACRAVPQRPGVVLCTGYW